MSPQPGAPLSVNVPSPQGGPAPAFSCLPPGLWPSRLSSSPAPATGSFSLPGGQLLCLASEEMALLGTSLGQAFGQITSPGEVTGGVPSTDAHPRWGLLLLPGPQGKATLLQVRLTSTAAPRDPGRVCSTCGSSASTS